MRAQTLKKIREFIACPQFGDENYGAWGALNLKQRKTILGLLEHIEFQKIDIEFFKEENQRLEKENKNLENLVAINKGAMREYREAFENAHDEAVADFSHFLIDKAKDGSIDICDLPDLVAEWKDKLPQSAELTAPSGREPDEAWLMERFMKVE